MPTVRTIVADLYSNNATGMRGLVNVYNHSRWEYWGEVDGFRNIKKMGTAIDVVYSAANHESVFNVDIAPRGAGNGFCLGYQDDHSTLVTLTRNQRICVSGEYSGCLFSVYHAGGGEYKCVHSSRPGTNMLEAYVQALRQYAARNGWDLMYEIPSRNDANSGVGAAGCVGTLFVTRISYTVAPMPVVRTVRLRIDNMGNSVYRSRWTKPTNGAVVIDNP